MMRDLVLSLTWIAAILVCTPAGALSAPAGVSQTSGKTASSSGLLGIPLATVLNNSEFFQFYHLKPVDLEKHADGNTVVWCRPKGGPFSEVAQVVVASGPDGKVFQLVLTLARSFIDDSRNGIYARDIAKYFLRSAPSPEVTAQMPELIGLIAKGSPLQSGARDDKADPSSREYAIFRGAQDSFTVHMTGTTFMIEPGKLESGAPAVSLYFIKSDLADRLKEYLDTKVNNIGIARMAVDGTITLELSPNHAMLTYRKTDPGYASVLKHVGGLRPGQTKPVNPWPDQ